MISARYLLNAYRQAAFPMALPKGGIGWFSPDPRAILPINDEFHIPHGLKRALKKGGFEIRVDAGFETVMRECAVRDETWIDEAIIASYVGLHQLGCAHSVEVWIGGELAGGLYGVALGGVFFGESMFHKVRDASKFALWALVLRLRERGFGLLDVQWLTPHLATFGAKEISRAEYVRRLADWINRPCRFVG